MGAAGLTLSVPMFVTSPEREKQARRGLLVYFALLIPLSTVFDVLASTTGNYLYYISFGLMFMPALSSIIARVALREGVADVSFRLGGRRGLQALLVALLLPAGIGLLAYGTGWITGLTPFAAPSA
jgi:uncharacterized protein